MRMTNYMYICNICNIYRTRYVWKLLFLIRRTPSRSNSLKHKIRMSYIKQLGYVKFKDIKRIAQTYTTKQIEKSYFCDILTPILVNGLFKYINRLFNKNWQYDGRITLFAHKTFCLVLNIILSIKWMMK
jgi:hypothetical protein